MKIIILYMRKGSHVYLSTNDGGLFTVIEFQKHPLHNTIDFLCKINYI